MAAARNGGEKARGVGLAPGDSVHGSLHGSSLHGASMNGDHNDTIHGAVHGAVAHVPQDGAAVSAPAVKVCCVCGANVAGKKRYKDHLGRYFCADCGESGDAQREAAKKTPAVVAPPPPPEVECPDCHNKVMPDKIVDYEGQRVCGECAEKKRVAARRAEARKRAAEEEARQEEARKKRLILISVIVGVLIVGFVAWKMLLP